MVMYVLIFLIYINFIILLDGYYHNVIKSRELACYRYGFHKKNYLLIYINIITLIFILGLLTLYYF